MSLTQPALEGASAPATGPERRVAPRYPILQRCFAWPPGAQGAEGWRCIAYNISTTGIGLTISAPLQKGAILEIEAWGLPAAPRLRARLVHAKFIDFLWFCGCELLEPLGDDDLHAWLAGPVNWLQENEGRPPA